MKSDCCNADFHEILWDTDYDQNDVPICECRKVCNKCGEFCTPTEEKLTEETLLDIINNSPKKAQEELLAKLDNILWELENVYEKTLSKGGLNETFAKSKK